MTMVDSQPIGAAEPQGNLDNTSTSLHGKFVSCCLKRGCSGFQWTETGRHGLAVLRRCVYLQHTLRARRNAGPQADGTVECGSQLLSGAARCFSLMQASGEPDGGCLERAASSFLVAAWSELRHMVVQELYSYVAIMRSLEEAAPEEALLTALLHMWSRCRLWTAFYRAPAELLGDLNETWTNPLAPEALSQLRGAVAMLLQAWQAGLVQVGQQLEAAVRRARPELGEEACEGWLLSWRLYLDVHRRMEVFVHMHSLQLDSTQPPPTQDMEPAEKGCGPGQNGRLKTDAAPHPLKLLMVLTSARAEKAACAAEPALKDAAAGSRLDVLSGSRQADQPALAANQRLRTLGLHLAHQLQAVLEEEDPAAAVVRQQKQGSGRAVASGSGASAEPAAVQEPLLAAGDTGALLQPGDRGVCAAASSRLGKGTASAGWTQKQRQHQQRQVSCPVAPASSVDSGSESCAVPLLDVLDALGSVLPRKRVGRLCDSPGLLALQHYLVTASRPSPEALLVAETAATSQDDSQLRHTRAAALAFGACVSLHQAHRQLAAMHCMANVTGSPDQPAAYRALQEQEPVVDEDVAAPAIAVTQLHTDAPTQRLEAALTAAGAAALAAQGARQDGGKAVVVHAAAARAAMLAEMAWAEAGGSGKGERQPGQKPAAHLPVRQQTTETLDKATDESMRTAVAWAQDVEAHVRELEVPVALAPGGDGRLPGTGDDAGQEADLVATHPGAPRADRAALLHAALLLAAGRVCLLAPLCAPGTGPGGKPPRGQMFRWEGPGAGTEPAWWMLAFWLAVVAARTGSGSSGAETSAQPSPVAGPDRAWRLSTPTSRLAVLNSALTACAAAVNRIAHVPKRHCPGPGADLKALCVAHSDAMTLGTAAGQLLAAAQALSLAAWGQNHVASQQPRGSAHPVRLSPAASAPAAGRSCGTVDGLRPAHSGVAVQLGKSGSGAPRLPRKSNWRRSFRRIMPYLGSDRGKGRGASSSGGGNTSGTPGQPPAGPGPLARHGCWAGDPVEPMQLPSPRPLSLMSRQDTPSVCPVDTAPGNRRGPKQAGMAVRAGVYKSEALARQPTTDVHRLLQAADSEGGAGASVSGALAPFPAATLALLSARQGEARDPPDVSDASLLPVPVSAAESSAHRLLHALVAELRRTAARVAELLGTEMSERIAAVYRMQARTGDTVKSRTVAPQASPSATQQVVANLLRPLAEALVGLHPASQTQLLCISYACAMPALRQVVRAATGTTDAGGAGSSGFSIRRGGGGAGRGGERVRALEGDLQSLQEELTAAWAQVDVAAAERGWSAAGRLGVKGYRGSGLGVCIGSQHLVRARADLGIQLRIIKAELEGHM